MACIRVVLLLLANLLFAGVCAITGFFTVADFPAAAGVTALACNPTFDNIPAVLGNVAGVLTVAGVLAVASIPAVAGFPVLVFHISAVAGVPSAPRCPHVVGLPDIAPFLLLLNVGDV